MSSAYLDPELFVSLLQRVSLSLDRASNFRSSSSSSQHQQQLGQALRQYLSGGNWAHGSRLSEHHQRAGGRQLLASYVALNELQPSALLSTDKRQPVAEPAAVATTMVLKNPLKVARILRPSLQPASLFRVLNAGQ